MTDIETMINRLTDRQRSEFALACARRVQHLMRDPRSIEALDTRQRWLRGEATDEEMAAARDAARDAARAASATAWASAPAAAWAAAWDAELAWQREELERMLGEGGWRVSDRHDWMAGMTDFQRAEVARLESRIVSFEKRWESLEADWNDCKKALAAAKAELAAAIKQRDEARRELCRVIGYQRQDRFDATAIAAERGWKCFEKGGGA